MTDIRLLKFAEVQERVNLPKSQIYRLIGKGEFPAPLKFGKASRWRSDEIHSWIISDHHPRELSRPKNARATEQST